MKKLCILNLLVFIGGAMLCNYHPLNPKLCISNTNGIKCQFSQFENACVDALTTSIGCKQTLNKDACLNQLTNPNESEAKCVFRKKCLEVRQSALTHLGCHSLYSKYACTNVLNAKCYWNENKCVEFTSTIPIANSCEEVFQYSVNPLLCQQIEKLKCINSGFPGDYKCVTVSDKQFSQILCTDSGINESTCISISTPKQTCIFLNNLCQTFSQSQISSCSSNSINRLACLTISDPKKQCQWKNNKCIDFEYTSQSCSELTEVNSSVCSIPKESCSYDKINMKCQKHNSESNSTCNTPGLNESACLRIKNYYCSYYYGICQTLSTEDLSYYQCEMKLNEDSCVSITTQFQYCKWNSDLNICQRLFINQDNGCTSADLVNGNVCKAISKPDVICKYNKTNKKCVTSKVDDQCTEPYLNQLGCISITKSGITCQWSNEIGCQSINIIQFQTTCNSLGYANPNACSQIYEGNSLGCYFNTNTQQCTTLLISSNEKFDNSTDPRKIKIDALLLEAKQMLNKFECSSSSYGFNKVICALITTSSQTCRWYQGSCQQIKKKDEIASTSCLKMQFVSPNVCSYVTYKKEPCRYNQNNLGCTSALSSDMNCTDQGLNMYACAQVSKNCYFDYSSYQCKNIIINSNGDQISETTALLSTMECVSNSPTKDVCKLITTPGQLCSWSERHNQCTKQHVSLNDKCSNYQGSYISVNVNVCASIQMNFPDYDNKEGEGTDDDRGYCKYNNITGNCDVYTDYCSTTCCTEQVGINAHYCSRFSTQGVFIYCYFSNDQKCQQLTFKDVNIYNEKQVQIYYNFKKMTCAQMNFQSCWMIEWSTSQLCYHNGLTACININYQMYESLYDTLTVGNVRTNKYTCLAVSAINKTDEKERYFKYNKDTHKCESIYKTTTYATCQDSIGNRNACLGMTPDKNCKWDENKLQCLEITPEELKEIFTCNYNQNKKTCINNQYMACQFLNNSDRCVDAPTNVACDFFELNGPISQLACARITTYGQLCEYKDNHNICVISTKTSDGCDVTGGNVNVCYFNTKGQCRWDPVNYICYENQDNIDTLGCLDYLNQNLCLQVTKEPCIFDKSKTKCFKFSSADSSSINQQDYLFNKFACLSIVGGAYYYDPQDKSCKPISITSNECQSIKNPGDNESQGIKIYFNQYACLNNTRGSDCYWDASASINEFNCKPFTYVQSTCSNKILTNIKVCMNVPATCYWNPKTLKCVSQTISQKVKCSELQTGEKQLNQYNKLSCSSISESLSSFDSNQTKCSEGQEYGNKCALEKYCQWDSDTQSCIIYNPVAGASWNPVKDDDGKDTGSFKCDSYDPVKLNSCENIYSKTLCLYVNQRQCYFDLKQGGCNPLLGNELKLPDCNSIVQTCDVSATFNLACKQSEKSTVTQSAQQCISLQETIKTCEKVNFSTASYTCSNYISTQTSPIVCAGATDECMFNYENKFCTSVNASEISCDKSMSQKLCESNNCDYKTFGYCQQIPVNYPTDDYPADHYTCYLVNLFSPSLRQSICLNIKDYSCMFTTTCFDVTGYTCSKLKGYQVNLTACQNCTGDSTLYDSETKLCNSLTKTINKCDNLNQQACLLNTVEVMCKWNQLNNLCENAEKSKVQLDTNCTIYNKIACYEVNNQCLVDPNTNYCQLFVPNNYGCNSIILDNDNNKSKIQKLCLASNKESCYWDDSKRCLSIQDLSSFLHSSVNKYGCLNNINKPSGWSDINSQCYSIQFNKSFTKCDDIISQNISNNIVQFNGIACSQINTNSKMPCFRDQFYKCRTIVSADQLTCTTPGVNKQACISNTTGQCKYVSTDDGNGYCTDVKVNTEGCKDFLNVNACIIQSKSCQFNEICSDYTVNQNNIVVTEPIIQSISVCSSLDSTNEFTHSVIYSVKNKQCVDITNRSPYITSCEFPGINKYACLLKTTVYCQYQKNICSTITNKQFQNFQQCDETLNWYACTNLTKSNCKFQEGKCQEVKDDELCISFKTNNALVGVSVCASRQKDACMLDTTNNYCILVSENKKDYSCTESGLNQKACQFNTEGQCIFTDNQCQFSYEDAKCLDSVNKDKCLSIQTPKQYCRFVDDEGCQDISDDINVCLRGYQVNPVACAAANDETQCLYNSQFEPTDKDNCISYQIQDIIDKQYLLDWDFNWFSFNKQTCIEYNQNNLALQWIDDQCQIIPQSYYSYLKCSDEVNIYGCININTEGEYCQFVNNCKKIDFSQQLGGCLSYTNINNPFICQNVTDKACQYDSKNKKCIAFTDNANQNCTSFQGLNKLACTLKDCFFNDNNKSCYLNHDNQSCNNENCHNVISEGCNKNCDTIQNYLNVECQDVVNLFGCVRIKKENIYCQYQSNECQELNPYSQSESKCTNITYVNNSIFCEQPMDEACTYSDSKNSCILVSSDITNFSCVRGLNKLACLNNTIPSLKCQFYSYCYGPNNDFLNCTDQEDCCLKANSKESCLFQTQYSCQWINGNNKPCSAFKIDLKMNPQNCNNLSNVSRNICQSLQVENETDTCIFNIQNFKCESKTLNNCDEAQSQTQCCKITTMPCQWINDQCSYKPNSNTDQCSTIKNLGNKMACQAVDRVGQMCIFDNQMNSCVSFTQDSTDNCLENINKISCISQFISDCIWITNIKKIKQTSFSSEEIDLIDGKCIQFTMFDQTQCSDALSYTSCLKITKINSQCQWQNGSCSQLNIQNNYSKLILVNSNACGLINSGIMVKYDDNFKSCVKINDTTGISCSPLTPGLNKKACIGIKKQACKWDSLQNYCVLSQERLLQEEFSNIQVQQRILSISSCINKDLEPEICSQLQIQQPCGADDTGCILIDINTAKCDDDGINEYACLHLTTGPCAWVHNTNKGLYQCETYYPYTPCTKINLKVNQITCSFVDDDACIYNKEMQTCTSPNYFNSKCDIPGINLIACSQIDGCIFQDYKCYQLNKNENILCDQVPQANAKVCSQAIDRCKYSNFSYGCVTSTITDNCYQVGLSPLGCNALDTCSWNSITNQCECIAYLNAFPQCDQVKNQSDCTNLDYCYFELSQQNISNNQVENLKNTNYGKCRNKLCSDIDLNKCDGYAINNSICYLSAQNICLQANTCEEIILPFSNCSIFMFNKIQCRKSETIQNQCETLFCNQISDQITCLRYSSCIYSGYCKNKTCEQMDQIQCLQNNCDWNSQTQLCQIQKSCSSITNNIDCLNKKEQGIQCAWVKTTEITEVCANNGCRFLGDTHGDCMGTHIGKDVCVQLYDYSCVACEEINDACICLNQSQYCLYDRLNQKCKSNSCQNHDQINCPKTHCRFNQKNNICLPLCNYNYNQLQCDQDQECKWDTINNLCVATLENIVTDISIILLPSNALLVKAILIILLILI